MTESADLEQKGVIIVTVEQMAYLLNGKPCPRQGCSGTLQMIESFKEGVPVFTVSCIKCLKPVKLEEEVISFTAKKD